MEFRWGYEGRKTVAQRSLLQAVTNALDGGGRSCQENSTYVVGTVSSMVLFSISPTERRGLRV